MSPPQRPLSLWHPPPQPDLPCVPCLCKWLSYLSIRNRQNGLLTVWQTEISLDTEPLLLYWQDVWHPIPLSPYGGCWPLFQLSLVGLSWAWGGRIGTTTCSTTSLALRCHCCQRPVTTSTRPRPPTTTSRLRAWGIWYLALPKILLWFWPASCCFLYYPPDDPRNKLIDLTIQGNHKKTQ